MSGANSTPSQAERQVISLIASDKSALDRFWSKVQPSEGCWNWTAAKNEKGYGVFGINRDTFKAHRVAFILSGQEIPDGLCLLHKCDNPACVNPDHMMIGTRAENNADMCAKGRHVNGAQKTPIEQCKYEKGEHHHNARLTAEIVLQIRNDRALGMSFSRIAAKYGIGQKHAHSIATRKAWKHV